MYRDTVTDHCCHNREGVRVADERQTRDRMRKEDRDHILQKAIDSSNKNPLLAQK